MFSRLATPGPAKLNTKVIQRRRKGEKTKSPATPDSADQILKTDEPGDRLRQKLDVFDSAGLASESGKAKDKSTLAKPEAKDESTLAQTGHIEVPRAKPVGIYAKT